MAEPYIPEEQTADWTSQAVRDFFRVAGFSVATYKLTQYLERDLPADRMFFDSGTAKIFGLQYKTIYHNGEDRWPIRDHQHQTLSKFPWIYYCCSELTDPVEHRTALHQARIYRSTFKYRPALLSKDRRNPRYYSWGEFYLNLKECKFGRRLWSTDEFEDLLSQLEGRSRAKEARQMYEVFLIELSKRQVLVPELLPSESL